MTEVVMERRLNALLDPARDPRFKMKNNAKINFIIELVLLDI